MTAAAAPQREIGYAAQAGSTSNNWWMYDGETTPELRWPFSVQVYDQMRTQDAQIESVLSAVMNPVLRTRWRIDPNGARDEVVRLVADDLGLPVVGESKPQRPLRMKDRFSWDEHLQLALLMLPFGHMYFEQVYRVTEDGSRAHLRKLGPRLPRTIEEIKVARDGGLVSITQCGNVGELSSGPQQPIPVNRLVAYIHRREGGNWLGRSILRPVYKNWLLKDRLLRVQTQTVERNGMGVPTYTAAETEKDLTKGKALATSLRAGESSGAAIPNGATLALLGVTGTLPDADTPIRYHDEQIARAVLAHFLNLGTQTGSWALGTTFADFFTLSLQTLADQVADTATQHIVEDLVDVNWGEKEPAPRIVHDEIGSRQQATAAAIKSLVDAGILEPDEVLEESTRQQYGLPPKDPDTTRGDDAAGGMPPAGVNWVAAGEQDPKVDAGGEPVAGPYSDLDEDDDEDDEDLAEVIYVFVEDEDDLQPVAATAPFNPALHPRGAHGRFRTVIGRFMAALGVGSGNPAPPAAMAAFTPAQLRSAANALGLHVPPRTPRGQLELLLDSHVSKISTRPVPGSRNVVVQFGGVDVGVMVPRYSGHWRVIAPPGAGYSVANRGQGFPTDGDAMAALVNAHQQHTGTVPGSLTIPGNASLVTMQLVPANPGRWDVYGGQNMGPNGSGGTYLGEVFEVHNGSGPVQYDVYPGAAARAAGVPSVIPGGPHPSRDFAARILRAATWNVLNPSGSSSTPSPSAPAPRVTTRRSVAIGSSASSVDVRVNGVYAGHVAKLPSGQWQSFLPIPRGNPSASTPPVPGGPWPRRKDALDALVQAHLNPPPALPPGVTLRPQTGGGGDAVELNGVKIGTVHPSGLGWLAYDANQNPVGTGAGHPTREAAALDVFNNHQAITSAPPAPAGPGPNLPNGITIDPFVSTNGSLSAAHAYYGGFYLGGLFEHSAGDWTVFQSGGMSWPITRQHFATQHDALDALRNAYTTSGWQAPTAGPAAPWGHRSTVANRVQDAITRHIAQGGGPNDPNDPLSGFTRAQLLSAARQHGVTIAPRTSTRAVSTGLIQALGPPPPAPPTPAAPAAPVDPAVKAAQDVLYGVDPKAKTATRQLYVYGGLRNAQFQSLAVHEQQAVLADLSFIATTSKGVNATRAQNTLNRFAPAGTPRGTLPTGSAQIVGPANGAQTRLPAPQSGLLKQAKNSGARGDTWMQGTAGPAVWGEYGSGGLLLRHVDAQGVERFLMTQRGTGISDSGKWSYPGGAFESLEDFYQGSTREVAEELGWTDTHFSGAMVHGYHVFERPDVRAKDGAGGTKPWTYHSVAADVPTMLTPNLSSSSARAETADAKWMTRAEIDRLDQRGELHGPVAGGKLQQNVMSLFPPAQQPVTRPGPITTRPPRLTGTPSTPQRAAAPHKPSLGRDLIPDQASKDKLRQDVKKARAAYSGKTADDRLAAIGAMQGFDDTPTVVPKSEFDRLYATGDYIKVYRGVKGAGGGWRSGRGGSVTATKTAAQVQEEMRSGAAWYGEGMYGNGFYFAVDKSVARSYGDGSAGSVVRALIPKTARTEKHSTVERKAHAASAQYSRARGRSHEEGTLYDEGRYAAAVGLDGIEIPYSSSSSHITSPGKPAFLIVNRSVLIVEEA